MITFARFFKNHTDCTIVNDTSEKKNESTITKT